MSPDGLTVDRTIDTAESDALEGDTFSVRLTWPDRAEGSGDPSPPPTGSVEPDSGPVDPRPAFEATEVVSSRPFHRSDVGSSVGLLVDAYERLGSRLLSRLRDLRTDVDGDLAELRSELASLRTAVEDVADRVQLRQMRSSIDELRSDVAGLRRAVLEWPELERVANDLSALRAAMSELQEQAARPAEPAAPPPAWEATLAELVAEVSALSAPQPPSPAPASPADVATEVAAQVAQVVAALPRPELAGLAPLVEELAELRAEMTSLRRRISLRASTEGPALGAHDLDAIAQAVVAKITSVAQPR